MFNSPTPASSSSSTLVTTTSTSTDSTSTSTQSLIPTPNSNATDSKPLHKPTLTLTTRLGASNSPKMSDKGFIEPHAGHLPRRVRRERTKTAPVPALYSVHEQELQQEQLEQQERQQQLERLREQLHLCQLDSVSEILPNDIEVNPIHPNLPYPLPQIQLAKQPPVSTYPHRDNLPRRTRVHERSKTTPINHTNTNTNTNTNKAQTRRIPTPFPISIVDSQSTITSGQITSSIEPPPQEAEAETLLSPNPLPFKFNSKALSLISKAQNKAFKSHIVIDNDDDPGLEDSNHLGLDSRQVSSPMSTSPQLPHPAMGLTMGIMEAYATEEESEVEVGAVNSRRPPHALLKFGLNYSPALGVKGTPPPPLPSSTTFPVGSSRFVAVPVPAPIPAASSTDVPTGLIPRIEISKPTPVLGLTPPVTAPLGQNLPRRHHRNRRREPQPPEAVVRDGDGDGGEKVEKEVLRFERGRVNGNGTKRNRVEGNEEEDGLFSSLLDFERAGSDGVGDIPSRRAVSGARGRRRRGRDDERCIQVLGRSCVEVGYMNESEVKGKGDCVLVEAISDGDQRRLELCLPDNAAVCREGVPSLLPEQVRAGCEFMKGLGKRRIRISVPRWRAQDAFGLAVCFLVWLEAQRDGGAHVSLKVNDFVCLDSYTPIHQLYMRLLDDGNGRGEEHEREWDVRREGKSVGVSEKVGLGLIGVDLGPRAEESEDEGEGEDEQSAHSTSTTGSSRPTLVGMGGGHHVREAALGGLGSSSEESSSSATSLPWVSQEWTGLRDEWRGVLSYEGLNTLVGVWP